MPGKQSLRRAARSQFFPQVLRIVETYVATKVENIPYEFEGVGRAYEPDCVVKLLNGVTLIVEIKGQFHDETEMKHQAADQWLRAVNRWGQLGRWDFLACRDPQQRGAMLAERLGRAAA